MCVRVLHNTRWYVPGAFFSPNGMRVDAFVPKCVVNLTVSRPFGVVKICEYLELESRVLKIRASPRPSIHSSILGIGYASRIFME